MRLSFVIPARNEATRLPKLFDSIERAGIPDGLDFEVIVVDNGSEDDTATVARTAGARVVTLPDARTVAAVRNAGAREARSAVLAFLDADVQVTNRWGRRIGDVVVRLEGGSREITGCEVSGAGDASWIERIWFGVEGKDQSHINTANMVVPKALFDELEGFEENLVSAEDYNFCRRAREAGAAIRPDTGLEALHPRYPDTIGKFFVREIWHGVGDYQTIGSYLSSKVALACTVLWVILVASILGVVAGTAPWLLTAPVAALGGIAFLSALRRKKKSAAHLIPITALYVVFFVARSIAPWTVFFGGKGDAWRRAGER